MTPAMVSTPTFAVLSQTAGMVAWRNETKNCASHAAFLNGKKSKRQ